jgi:hypothetical protein
MLMETDVVSETLVDLKLVDGDEAASETSVDLKHDGGCL